MELPVRLGRAGAGLHFGRARAGSIAPSSKAAPTTRPPRCPRCASFGTAWSTVRSRRRVPIPPLDGLELQAVFFDLGGGDFGVELKLSHAVFDGHPKRVGAGRRGRAHDAVSGHRRESFSLSSSSPPPPPPQPVPEPGTRWLLFAGLAALFARREGRGAAPPVRARAHTFNPRATAIRRCSIRTAKTSPRPSRKRYIAGRNTGE